MSTFEHLTIAQLKQAITIREEISSFKVKLDGLIGGAAPAATTKKKVGRPAGKRTMSAETIQKMRAAQQARWAKVKPVKASAKEAPKKKGITAEGRAKLAAAMEARWAVRKNAA